MKKSGFTLAELMITLGIIGIGAALVAPAISNLMPNKNKIYALKAYNSISEITNHILDDQTIYYHKLVVTDGEARGTNDCIGLGCTYMPVATPYNTNDYTGTKKYGELLNAFLAKEPAIGERDEFVMENNVIFKITDTDEDVNTDNKKVLHTKIELKVPGKEENDKTFSETCKRPNIFTLEVDTYGKLTPTDPMLKAYLESPTSMSNIKKDINRATQLLKANSQEEEIPSEDSSG